MNSTKNAWFTIEDYDSDKVTSQKRQILIKNGPSQVLNLNKI